MSSLVIVTAIIQDVKLLSMVILKINKKNAEKMEQIAISYRLKGIVTGNIKGD